MKKKVNLSRPENKNNLRQGQDQYALPDYLNRFWEDLQRRFYQSDFALMEFSPKTKEEATNDKKAKDELETKGKTSNYAFLNSKLTDFEASLD